MKAYPHWRRIQIHPELSGRIAIQFNGHSFAQFGTNANSSPVWMDLNKQESWHCPGQCGGAKSFFSLGTHGRGHVERFDWLGEERRMFSPTQLPQAHSLQRLKAWAYSHRMRNQICMQICTQTLWCCLQPVWTLPFTAVCSIICVCLLQGAPRPVWTRPWETLSRNAVPKNVATSKAIVSRIPFSLAKVPNSRQFLTK